MLLDPRNGPQWDLPPAPDANPYIVASTPRTGSTLLCRTLWDAGGLGAPKEYLNPMQLRDWQLRLGGRRTQLRLRPVRGPLLATLGRTRWRDADLQAYLDGVRARRSSPRWFGLKLHHHHLQRMFRERDLETFLGPVTWLRITRRDRVAQAVSWVRAAQSGRWASTQRGWGTPEVYSRRQIRDRLREIDQAEAAWDARLSGATVIAIEYEALTADLEGTVSQVYRALDTPFSGVSAPSLTKQADSKSTEWIARYRAGQ